MPRGRYIDHRAEVQRSLAEIDEIVDQALKQDDLLVQSFLIRFATIRLSGHFEQALGIMIRGFLMENTTHRVLRFSSKQASRLSNLNPRKLGEIVMSFDEQWARELDSFLSNDERRQSLGNLIQSRHDLAHGKNSVVSASKLEQYRSVAIETIDLLFEWFLPIKGGSAKGS